MDKSITTLARRQLIDYRNSVPWTCFADPGFQLDGDTAYQLQGEVIQLRIGESDSVASYKASYTTKGIKEQFGMNGPIRGTLFGSELFANNELIGYQSFYNIAIEAEMALKIVIKVRVRVPFPLLGYTTLFFDIMTKHSQNWLRTMVSASV